jgi:hypothetical protein
MVSSMLILIAFNENFDGLPESIALTVNTNLRTEFSLSITDLLSCAYGFSKRKE